MKLTRQLSHATVLLLIFPFLVSSQCGNKNEIFIRTNQVGYLPGDTKSAIILSDLDLRGVDILVVNSEKNREVFRSKLFETKGEFGEFNYSYEFDFSGVEQKGVFNIRIENADSYKFRIGNDVYDRVVNELMKFFRVQRCGYTNPSDHGICHIHDVASLIEDGIKREESFDVTGGWHDAADYIKFLNTTAYTTYTLLFAYEFDPVKFGFDNDRNGTPDIIEEAKIGLDWLLRANYNNEKFVTQVQDLADHDVGWRMPEDDPIAAARPAFLGVGKNLIGIYSATMAIASRIWRSKFDYDNFSDKCLKYAENFYSIRNNVTDIDTTGTGHYRDNEFLGKLALAAVEMYITTNNNRYLDDAVLYAEKAGSDYWWSWGNMNSYAHYRLSAFDPKFTQYIKNNLDAFSSNSNSKLFGEGTALTWGSNHTLLGVALQAVLYKRITGSTDYDKLSDTHRDYVLGRNQWGISFISNIGMNYSRNFHHQISYLTKSKLPGGFAAGPVLKSYLDEQNIEFESNDKFEKFQTDEACYRDDRMDYITNEPTISANAAAVFVMGYYSGK